MFSKGPFESACIQAKIEVIKRRGSAQDRRKGNEKCVTIALNGTRELNGTRLSAPCFGVRSSITPESRALSIKCGGYVWIRRIEAMGNGESQSVETCEV